MFRLLVFNGPTDLDLYRSTCEAVCHLLWSFESAHTVLHSYRSNYATITHGEMIHLPTLIFGLAATVLKPAPPIMTTWLIDGNNLKCFRGVPDDRSQIIAELGKISSPKTQSTSTRITHVVLVFDGNHNETFTKTVSPDCWFTVCVTEGFGRVKDRADDYIVNVALPESHAQTLELLAAIDTTGGSSHSKGRVHLVSADKKLGKRAARLMGGGSIVHPQKFWQYYLTNLQQAREKDGN